jgi:threonine dehydratase
MVQDELIDDCLQRILQARVYEVAIETPLEAAPRLSARLDNQVLFKCEDLQPVFSFRIRGGVPKPRTCVSCIRSTIRSRPSVSGASPTASRSSGSATRLSGSAASWSTTSCRSNRPDLRGETGADTLA